MDSKKILIYDAVKSIALIFIYLVLTAPLYGAYPWLLALGLFLFYTWIRDIYSNIKNKSNTLVWLNERLY